MQASRLRQLITIQRKTVASRNALNEPTYNWTASTFGPVHAEVLALKGREWEAQRQTWAEARWRVTMRFVPGLTVNREDRILWGTRVLDILDAEDPDGRRREFVMICRELAQ